MRERLGPLDGLRGIAITLVVWFHVWQITWLRANVAPYHYALDFNAIPETGFLGVDLFFFSAASACTIPMRARRSARSRRPRSASSRTGVR